MYTCANCNVLACASRDREKLPVNCPMHQEELIQEVLETYQEPDNRESYIKASRIEGEGYGQWPRLRETAEVRKKMGYYRIGLAFCKGLQKKARVVADLLREQGLDVVSTTCRTGGFEKELSGIPREGKTHPEQPELMCNLTAQARLLNSQKTEFNIALSLCVGHDSVFCKYPEALVITLVVKDRALAHNPCGAIYCADGYSKQKLRGQWGNDDGTARDQEDAEEHRRDAEGRDTVRKYSLPNGDDAE